jgi:uncharacterized protein
VNPPDTGGGTPWGCILFCGGGLLAITAFMFAGIGWMAGTAVMPDEPLAEVDAFDPGADHVRLTVRGTAPEPNGYGHTLELQAADGRVLPMLIGQAEADAIQRSLDGIPVPRPMTHDLAIRLLEGLEGRLVGVTIRKLEDETFHAALFLERADGSLVQVDSRSSDAVALALRARAPVYAHEDVLASAGY